MNDTDTTTHTTDDGQEFSVIEADQVLVVQGIDVEPGHFAAVCLKPHDGHGTETYALVRITITAKPIGSEESDEPKRIEFVMDPKHASERALALLAAGQFAAHMGDPKPEVMAVVEGWKPKPE